MMEIRLKLYNFSFVTDTCAGIAIHTYLVSVVFGIGILISFYFLLVFVSTLHLTDYWI